MKSTVYDNQINRISSVFQKTERKEEFIPPAHHNQNGRHS